MCPTFTETASLIITWSWCHYFSRLSFQRGSVLYKMDPEQRTKSEKLPLITRLRFIQMWWHILDYQPLFGKWACAPSPKRAAESEPRSWSVLFKSFDYKGFINQFHFFFSGKEGYKWKVGRPTWSSRRWHTYFLRALKACLINIPSLPFEQWFLHRTLTQCSIVYLECKPQHLFLAR